MIEFNHEHILFIRVPKITYPFKGHLTIALNGIKPKN